MEALGIARPQSSPLDILTEDELPVPSPARADWNSFRSALRQALEPALGDRPAAQVEAVRRFYSSVLERTYDDSLARLRDLEALERIAAGYGSLERFITDLTLDPPGSTEDFAGTPLLDEDYLILSTIHSAKGCEWDEVHVIHAVDGMIPSDMALSDDDGLDEERRIFYVALTRARHMLCVYFPVRYYHRRTGRDDAHGYGQLSRFISEPVRALFEQDLPEASGGDHLVEVELGHDSSSVDTLLSSLWAE
jgi:DNA helicase II / ATP-dependent DNA helicase PcrA